MKKLVKISSFLIILISVILLFRKGVVGHLAIDQKASTIPTQRVVEDKINVKQSAAKFIDSSESEEEAPEIDERSSLKEHGVSRLMLMAFHDKSERFKEAINKYSKEELLKMSDNEGAGLVHWAVMGNCLSCLSELLNSGQPIDLKNKRGETPLVFAVGSGDFEATSLLLKRGANPNISFNKSGYTLLMDSSFEGNIEVSKALISAKASINSQDKEGKSALHYAAKEGHRELISVLLKSGANSQLKDLLGKKAIDYALDYHDVSIKESFRP